MTMNEHDDLDDSPDLRDLRELHHGDRMPTDMRERVLRRAQLPRAPERSLLGQGELLGQSSLSAQNGLFGENDAASSPLTSAEPAGWGEPARSPRRRPGRGWMLLGAGTALSVAAALALWLELQPSQLAVESEHPAPLALTARPHSAEELQALGAQPGVSEVRVVGSLVTGSLTRLPPLPPHQRIRCGYHFHLREPGVTTGDGIHVEYARCRAPENLIDDGATCVEVTAIGLLREDGHVDATRITPKVITPCSVPR